MRLFRSFIPDIHMRFPDSQSRWLYKTVGGYHLVMWGLFKHNRKHIMLSVQVALVCRTSINVPDLHVARF